MNNLDLSLFTPVKMRIVHDGPTDKGYIFTMDSIAKASESLKNTPVLAYYDSEIGDARGHEMGIERDMHGRPFMKFYERPIGLIPESAEVQFEFVPEEGKTYATTTGLIWKKYANEMNQVLTRDSQKKISMEVIIDEMFSTEKGMVVMDYRYTGITVLGNDIQPGVSGASIEVLDQLSLEFSKEEKGDEELDKTKMTVNGELIGFSTDKIEDSSLTEKGSLKLPEGTHLGQKVASSTQENENEVTETEKVEDENKNSAEKKDEDLTGEDENSKLDELLGSISKEELAKLILEKQKEDLKKAEEEKAEPEKTAEDSAIKTSAEEVKKQADDAEDNESVTKAELQALREEVETYRKILQEQEKQKKERLLSDFDDIKDSKEYAELKVEDLSYEELEIRLYAIRGKILSSSKTAPKQPEQSRAIPDPLSNLRSRSRSQIVDKEQRLAEIIRSNTQEY